MAKKDEAPEVKEVKAPKEPLGIKELSEILVGLKILSGAMGGVLADGKVNAADFKELVRVGADFKKVYSAIEDADKAIAEAKDLDQAEIVVIIGLIYEAVKAFNEGKKAE